MSGRRRSRLPKSTVYDPYNQHEIVTVKTKRGTKQVRKPAKAPVGVGPKRDRRGLSDVSRVSAAHELNADFGQPSDEVHTVEIDVQKTRRKNVSTVHTAHPPLELIICIDFEPISTGLGVRPTRHIRTDSVRPRSPGPRSVCLRGRRPLEMLGMSRTPFFLPSVL